MALKSTVFKVDVDISDLDRNHYASHALTLARHPSETDERLMVRLIAFLLFADAGLEFGRGLSAEDEPALWQKDLTGNLELWIEVGLPDARLLRRACGRARRVVVLAYGERAVDVWWQQNRAALTRLANLRILRLAPQASRELARLAERKLKLHATIQEGGLWLDDGRQTLRIEPLPLQEAAPGE